MAVSIEYRQGMDLELWIQDTGRVEGYTLYLNGFVIDRKFDGNTHRHPIPRPAAPIAVVVQFGGADGGISQMVDAAGGGRRGVGDGQDAKRHEYVVVPV